MGVLDGLSSYQDFKNLNIEELKVLATEIRQEIIEMAKVNGGHLASNLGVVELTIALHYVFDFPTDKLVLDVGHQCYTHKLITGRREKCKNIRQKGGISGFPDFNESEFDTFICGHAGTALSSSLGLANARDALNENYNVISVVGDGSFSNGLSLEGLMSSTIKPKNFLTILNDNGMSISKNKHGFYKVISRSTASKGYIKFKRGLKKLFGNSFITTWLRGTRNFFKRIFNKNSYYIEQFGFKYVGGVDGNDLEEVIKTLKKVKDTINNKAVLLHVNTVKGIGLEEAESNAEEYHGVGKGLLTGSSDFSNALGSCLEKIMLEDEKVTPITAGMLNGTGLYSLVEKFPNRVIDVGIAEEHAVTYASGLAKGGLKPIVCIYSTFMQRAYDQIMHDVCINNLPVVFCLDRAGLVGADGKTHQGVFDLSYLSHMPNMNILAPKSTAEFEDMLKYAISLKKPCAIRYPNGKASQMQGVSSIFERLWEKLSVGKKVSVLAVGQRMITLAQEIEKELKSSITIINARSVKPLDEEMLVEIKKDLIVTLEENSLIGGFGSLVKGFYAENNLSTKVLSFGIKDAFVEHGSVSEQLEENGLTAKEIVNQIKQRI